MKINRHGLQFGSMDVFDYTTLGDVMTRWLEKFMEHGKIGCPQYYLNKVVIREDGSYTDEEIEKGIELFYDDVEKLIWALDDTNEPVWGNEPWGQYKVKLEKYDEERKEALALFADLYTMLWR